jgi:hypothetical protein
VLQRRRAASSCATSCRDGRHAVEHDERAPRRALVGNAEAAARGARARQADRSDSEGDEERRDRRARDARGEHDRQGRDGELDAAESPRAHGQPQRAQRACGRCGAPQLRAARGGKDAREQGHREGGRRHEVDRWVH